ncbi:MULTISPECIES: hypothetical protein [Lactobacillus]|uniref:LiaF transmembrane domain-containing protein n=1 Tax=Lactobacillus xujianguonis TaxID=2495899 RepID=A0A437SWR0_9LACO|nr:MULTISPECIES: hypothetical protein [Lactobacillus]RVU71378.1 hypothetical protein EJK17_02760 [Lactobacillus xujianguonis]RVU76961.1 hypothetical protein EJK20_03150 [Lactobacillus xujianguonis]
MRGKVSRIFWGLFFLACAIFIVLNQMGIWTYRLGFWAAVGTVIFAISLIDGLVNRRITEAVFSVAFILMIFAQPLHITKLVPWTILLAAVLISIGLGIIFRNRFHTVVYANKKIKDFRDKRENITDHLFTDTVTKEDGAHILVKQTMSDTSKYIHSKALETIDVDAKMSDVNLYLDDTQAAGETVTLNLNLTMTDLTVYLPLSWQVESNMTSGFMTGDLEIDGTSNGGGPTLIIGGHTSMSDVEIKYV